MVVPSPLTTPWRARLAASPSIGTTRSTISQPICLREVCPDVEVEPQLQPLMTESLALRSARVADEDRPDIRAKGLWTNTWHDTCVHVRVFHPDCPSYLSTAVPALYMRFEKEKKRQYGQRVREVELGSFTPPPPHCFFYHGWDGS